jgi:hypothetical protein
MWVSEAGVVLGVVLEGTEYVPPIHKRWPTLEKIGFLILVLSLVADWHFQSMINEEQTQDLIAAENRIVRMGPRAELLYGESRTNLVTGLKKPEFAQQKVEIKVCDVSFNQYFVDDDTLTVAERLQGILQESGWSADLPDRKRCNGGTGIWIQVSPKASRHTRDAAALLTASLKTLPMEADQTADLVAPEEVPKSVDTIVITVEAHPL